MITAESQLATDQQALVQAQTTRLQDETKLLNDITKDPLSAGLIGIQIVPTTAITTPAVVEDIPIQDAVNEAWEKRPEIQQAALNLKNAGVEVKATRNLLLPSVNLYGELQANGIAGNQHTTCPPASTARARAWFSHLRARASHPAQPRDSWGHQQPRPAPFFSTDLAPISTL